MKRLLPWLFVVLCLTGGNARVQGDNTVEHVFVDSNYTTAHLEVLGDPPLDLYFVRAGSALPAIVHTGINGRLLGTPFEDLIFSEPEIDALEFLTEPVDVTDSRATALADMDAAVLGLGPGSFVAGPDVTEVLETYGPFYGGVITDPDPPHDSTTFLGTAEMTHYDMTAQWRPIPEPGSLVICTILGTLSVLYAVRRKRRSRTAELRRAEL